MDLSFLRQVEIVGLQGSEGKERIVGEHAYNVTPLSVVAKGTWQNLVKFSSELEKFNGQLLVIKNTSFSEGGQDSRLSFEIEMFSLKSNQPVNDASAKPKTQSSGR